MSFALLFPKDASAQGNSANPARSAADRLAGRAPREQGYVLLAVLFLSFLLALSLAVAASTMASEIEHDRERELIQRGLQYQRAVQLYYRKFSAFPPTIDALVKTNNIRFLRKKYKDPITGADDWVPIHFGEAKTPILGFFGQPLAGAGGAGGPSAIGGVGPSGGNGNIGTPAAGVGNSPSGFSMGGSSFGGGSFGGATPGASTPGAASSPTGGSAFGSNSPSSFGSSSNSSSQTFGGAGIIGFKIPSNKEAKLEYKKQKHFNEWEFYYDPSEEQFLSGNAALGQPIPVAGSNDATSFSGSTFGSTPGAAPGGATGAAGSSGFGSSPSSGFGSTSGGFGSSSGGMGSTSPAPPTQPQ